MGEVYSVVILPNDRHAKEFLEVLRSFIEKYGAVTMGDLLDLIDQPYVKADHDYGWKNLDQADIVPEPRGYALRLPFPVNL